VKRVLDTATALVARRPVTLLATSALSLVPAAGAVAAFSIQCLAPERPSPFGLLGVGVLSAGAWLTWCWGQAAGVRVCQGELEGQRVGLGEAIRRGLEDVPRVMVVAAMRMAALLLGALPFGAGLPHAATFTAGLVPAAVLDAAGPLEGWRHARRAPRAHAVAQALSWGLFPVVWANLVLAYGALLGWLVRMDPGRLEAALRDGPALGVLAVVAWWMVEPVRVAAAVAARDAWQGSTRGTDLVALARRGLLLLAVLLAASPARAEPLTVAAWQAYVWEARDAVLSGDEDAAEEVRGLVGREVSLGAGATLVVSDSLLLDLADRLQRGDPSGPVDTVHHLAALERLAQELGRSEADPGDWPVPVPSRSAPPLEGLLGTLETLEGTVQRVQSWGGSPGTAGEAWLGGRSLALSGLVCVVLGLAALGGSRRRLDPRPARVASTRPPLGAPLPAALQGTARGAVREGFHATLEALEHAGQVDDVARLTNGQVAARLHGPLWERYHSAREAFERTWYGGEAAGEAELLAVEEALSAARGRPE